jgi:TolB-like protein
MASKLSSFLAELRRRKVYHVAVAYVLVAAGILEAASNLLAPGDWERLRLPVVVIVLVCFPISLVLAWAYELRAEEPRGKNGRAESPVGPHTAGNRKSIVVLPFDNLSPDSGDAYFADGLTEEIITDLSCCGLLRVISRNSAMTFKETRKGTRLIAEELGVQYVLEGSVRKSGESLLVTAQLIDALADEHLWAERFTGTLEDVFEIQSRLSRSIVDSLSLKLTSQEEKSLTHRRIEDPRAYDTYLLAMHESHKLTHQGNDRAMRITEEALTVLGENALLSATMAQLHYSAYDMGFRHDQETLEQIGRWASKALKLDPELGQAHWATALVHFKHGDLPAYVRHGREAVRLSRDSVPNAHLAIILAFMGRTEEARSLAGFAVDRDPLSFFSHCAKAAVEIFSGHLEDGFARMSRAHDRLAKGEPFALWWEAQAAGYAGDDERARKGFEEVAGMGLGAFSDVNELSCRALMGDATGVWEVLDRPNLRDMGKADEYFPVLFANAFATLGEVEEAIRWLEQAVTWGFCNHDFLLRHDRYLLPLREDPRFLAVVARAREKEAALDG